MHARLITRRRRTSLTALMVAMALAIAIPASSLGTSRFPNPADPYVTLTRPRPGQRRAAHQLRRHLRRRDLRGHPGRPRRRAGRTGRPIRRPLHRVRAVTRPVRGRRRLRGLVGPGGAPGPEDAPAHDARRGPPAIRGFHPVLLGIHGRAGGGFADYTFFVNEESNDVIDVAAGAPYAPIRSTSPTGRPGTPSSSTPRPGRTTRSRAGESQPREHDRHPGRLGRNDRHLRRRHVHRAGSQMYMTPAPNPDEALADDGGLCAFQVTAHGVRPVDDDRSSGNDANDYLDIAPTTGGRASSSRCRPRSHAAPPPTGPERARELVE